MWKNTKYEGYQVNILGEIRSVDRQIIRSDTLRAVNIKGCLLKQNKDKYGYLQISLSVNGIKITTRVHRIVANTFIPNPNNLREVNHIDGNKSNNKIENLEWVTSSENQKHAIKLGLKQPKTGNESCKFTGPVEVYDKNGNYKFSMSGNIEMKN